MNRISEVWERLEENKNVITIYISSLIIVGVIMSTILIPAVKTAWYIATTEIDHAQPYEFKKCPPLSEGFLIESDMFTVDKKTWFCFSKQIPEKTYISEENAGRIDPTHETEDIAIFFIEPTSLTNNWKLVASSE